jgi:hypothetical protein
MGRYREYSDNADRQRAYRERKAAEEARLREQVRRLREKGEHRDKFRKRLVRVLGMLGSNHPGERDAAALMATRMVKEAGLTWYDILDVTEEK